MKRYSVVPIAILVLPISIALSAQDTLPAGQHMLRYIISMDGKPVGTSEVVVKSGGNGQVTLRSRTHIDIKLWLFAYRYASSSRETWSGDQLVSAEAETREDDETSRVSVRREANTVIVVTNKGERRLGGAVATTSFWNLPRLPDATLIFLDVETGEDFQARARFMGEAEIAIGDRIVPCRRWQLSVGTQTQLWFDRDNVLVRVEYEEQGRRFVHLLDRSTGAAEEKK